jgi:maltose/moltooligosaccharide transporter
MIQPIIGAMSDKTWHPRWGRRKPYFYWSIICSILYFYFHLVVLCGCGGLLWILDIGNNTAMEPLSLLLRIHWTKSSNNGFSGAEFLYW